MAEAVCRGCGKKITVYWWRKIYDWQPERGVVDVTVEKYCPECAACMIDRWHTNSLLCSDVIEPAED